MDASALLRSDAMISTPALALDGLDRMRDRPLPIPFELNSSRWSFESAIRSP